MSLAAFENIFGVRVVTTTKCPQGTAIVMDSKIACFAWTRMGMEILSSQFGDYAFQHNAWQFRGEEHRGGVQTQSDQHRHRTAHQPRLGVLKFLRAGLAVNGRAAAGFLFAF